MPCQVFTQIADVAAYSIILITECFFMPYFLIYLFISENASFVSHQQT